MKKMALVTVLAFSLLSSIMPTVASPHGCMPNQPPGGTCYGDIVPNDTYLPLPEVPFVWLRSAPSSTASVNGTIYTSGGQMLVTVKREASWDGYQWWWGMATYPDRKIQGWVEQASLHQSVPTAPPGDEGLNDPSIQVQAKWDAPFQAILDTSENVSFAWVREQPNAENILYTIRPNQPFQVTGSSAGDGYQWWWPVEINSSNGPISGWVEQGSISPLN